MCKGVSIFGITLPKMERRAIKAAVNRAIKQLLKPCFTRKLLVTGCQTMDLDLVKELVKELTLTCALDQGILS